MTPLRQQMHDAMLVRGLAERTRQTYIENVARLAIFYHRNPADLTPEQVEAWLLHLVRDRKLSYSTLNQAAAACRFFYGTVLKREHAARGISRTDGSNALSPGSHATLSTEATRHSLKLGQYSPTHGHPATSNADPANRRKENHLSAYHDTPRGSATRNLCRVRHQTRPSRQTQNDHGL